MGIEFRLGRSDHKVVDDFLARRPDGVSGIWVEPHQTRMQQGVIETAKALGLQVLVEPFTERLAAPGFTPKGLAYAERGPLDLELLGAGYGRDELVDAVAAAQAGVATVHVPPHFFVDSDELADLNVDLAGRALAACPGELRAVLTASRAYLARGETAKHLAAAYADAGIGSVELRLSPLGGDDESVRKVRTALEIVRAFRDTGMEVRLGYQGHIGQTALALGLVHAFSVGVGMRERVNHGEAIGRQTHPRDEDQGGAARGALAGVHLSEPAVTIPRGAARSFFQDRSIRTRLSCPIGSCASSIDGPLLDVRGHYLHARAQSVATLLSRPVPWRPAQEFERLSRALELRQILNNHHLPDGFHPFKTRTLRSLLDEMDFRREALSA